jgi:hypothetical protein
MRTLDTLASIALLTLAVEASSQHAGRVPSASDARRGRDSEEWNEDAERVTRRWREGPSTAEYEAAMQASGMGAWLRAGRPRAPVESSSSWVATGPFGGIPPGDDNGRVASLFLLPDGGSYDLYVGASSGGLWHQSSPGSGTWTTLGDLLPNPSVGAFVIDPADPQKIVVGTGDNGRSGGRCATPS